MDETKVATSTLDSESVPPAAELIQPHADTAGAGGPLEPPTESSNPATLEAGVSSPGTPQLPVEEALEKAADYTEPNVDIETFPGTDQPKYCPECYLPLYPDQKPEKLYIFLHALRYTTSLGRFETELPAWAAKGFKWDRD